MSKQVIQEISDFIVKTQQGSERGKMGLSDEIVAEMTKVFSKYFNTDKIEEKTELTGNDIIHWSKLRVWNKSMKDFFGYDIPFVEPLLQNIFHMNISKDRKGRQEVISALESFAVIHQREHEEKKDLLNDVFSRQIKR